MATYQHPEKREKNYTVKSCWLFHKWSLWTPWKEWATSWQKRKRICSNCAKVQEETAQIY